LIDYTKISLFNIDRQRLEKLKCLEFKTEVSEKTGLLSNKKIATYHHCKITIYDTGLILFTGSIHKLYNSLKGIKAPNYNLHRSYNGYNGNQFTINNILEVRAHLCLLFDCESNQMIFQNIEFGINTTPEFCPQLFITGLLFHLGKSFEFRFNRRYAEILHTRYRIKIYNKSEQYGINEQTLRIEISHKKAIDFSDTGIRTFEDINETSLNKALRLLLKRFDEIVYYDNTINRKELNKAVKRKLDKYSNIKYWLEYLKANKRDKHKKQLQKLIAENSKNLHSIIRDNLNKKGVIINRPLETSNGVIINTSYIGLNLTQNYKKKCPITGIDLSREKLGSKYIKTTTINYLRKYHVEVYQNLCSMFLPKNGKRPKFESDIVSHVCKNIRNRYYNPITIKQTGYRAKRYDNQLSLSL
jgi:hypothetical protein